MSSLLSAELAATCNALGYNDLKSNKYYADSNTLETVKDLIRYLRRDDDSHDIRRQLGETKVLQTDLLPLLKSYWEETDLFDVLLRLIVNLTTPALILYNQEVPTEKITRTHYLQIEDHLQGYKESFTDEGIWAVLSMRLSKILEIDYAERGDENSLIIERILILIRNILYVPADAAENRPDNDASVHDQVLWALHQSGLLDIILYISSSAVEQAYYMHILEILSFMLREQKASELAHAALQRSETEKIRDEAELIAIRHRETNQRQTKVKKYSAARHSRFGGTFVVKSMKSISDNEVISHKPLNKIESLNFDADKTKPKTARNRLPIVSSTLERRSAFTIRLFLKEFCVEFLNGAYNTFMYYVKDNLVRSKAQAHDESYYLWTLRFFMEFNRCYKFEVKLVSETMSVQAFHFVQKQSEDYFDLIRTDKRKLHLWSRRLHLALLAYRELFYTLCAMDKSPDGTVRDSSKMIKNNVFYVLEYREFILSLLVTYDELKMSDVYLRDLIETQHIFLKMLEGFCGKDGTIIVQKKAKRKKNKSKKKGVEQQPTELEDLDLEGRWDEASPQLSIVLEQGFDLNDANVVPFDVTSDVPVDDQKGDAMKNIQRKLRNGEYENAVGLLRASREVWPENDCFGSHNMAAEEEFLALRDIFFADLGENRIISNSTLDDQNDNDDEDEYDDDEEEEYDCGVQETDFKLQDFLKRLAHPRIIRACGLALRNFETNSVNTNHCIIKLLHRIAFDCKMYVMIFQVSIFQTFQKIFAVKNMPQHKELVKFAVYIIRQFFKVTEINKKVFMEALFWKSSRDAYDIEQGYGSYHSQSAAAAKAWTEQQEDELRRLFMEHQEKGITEDVVDWIVNNLIDNTKSRRSVLKKLKELFLLCDYKGPNKSLKSKIPTTWSVEEELQLRELYEQFADSVDPLTSIMGQLEIKRPKNRIVEKLLVMGLIQDRKEVQKKRSKKSGAASKAQNHGSDNDFGSSSDSEDNPDLSGGNSSMAKKRPANRNSNSRKKTTQKKKTSQIPRLSTAALTQYLLKLMSLEMDEALEWLKESFTDAIEDLEDGNVEGIPLVPIMDYAVNAMENGEFRQMLLAMGMCEPSDEQEAYWRISTNLTANVLKDYSDLIQRALDKQLIAEPETPINNNESDSDDDVFDKLKKLMKSTESEQGPSTSKFSTQEPSSDNGENLNSPINNSNNGNFNGKKNARNFIESDSEEEIEEEIEITTVSSGKNKSNITSDDDGDKENVDSNVGDTKRLRTLSDSDGDRPRMKRSRIIDSDED